MDSTSKYRLATLALATALPTAALYLLLAHQSSQRARTLPPSTERVLILGASSGVGHALAQHYALTRGARVCIVARRADKLAALQDTCGPRCMAVAADFAVAADMVRVREALDTAWGGFDTLLVCAGVSALRPVMALAGGDDDGGDDDNSTKDVGVEGVEKAVGIAGRAVTGNFTGPLVAALTFIPMLARTSQAPAILLISSMAAVIPAPTRALYCATKAASLLLYEALAIEHRNIAFHFILPATIEGDFRASAVDGGPVREADPNKHGLKADYVAEQCVRAVDARKTGVTIMPWFPYSLGRYMYALWPSVVEKMAAKKYNFP